MKKCEICSVKIASDKHYCPLCYNDIDGENANEYPLTEIKTADVKTKHTGRFLAKLFFIISLATFGICVFVNIESKGSYLWSMIVLTSIVYLWILVAHTILSKRSVFEKMLFQLLGVFAVVATTYALSPVETDNWLVRYVYPGVSMLAVAVMCLMSFISKNRKSHLFSFLVIYIGLLVISIILVFTIDSYKTLNNVNMLVTAIASVGTVLLGYRSIHKEFVKVFHL